LRGNPRDDALQLPPGDVRATNLGLKVFMDAHSTVTAEEGDRYPLGPPFINRYMDYSNIVHAKLNLTFDKELWIHEYDNFIYPQSVAIRNNFMTWSKTRDLNRAWGMVDPDIYDQCDIEDENSNLLQRGRAQWQMTQLLYLETIDSDSDAAKRYAYFGGSYMRNLYYKRTWNIKPEFENLSIVKYAYEQLPLTKIISMHCVSLEPGAFASIHRDGRTMPVAPEVVYNNGLRRQGYVSLVFNITDGGVPLYWALDGEAVHTPIKTNDDCYLTSDYFLHGVPVCTSRRRQIRITGIPNDQLAQYIDHNQKIEIPNDYIFDGDATRYPG
jgi:hypothetical protein